MRVVAVKCPECGAKLRPNANAAQVTCEYCGTVSRVQRKTGFFRAPPPPPGNPQQPVAYPAARWVVWMYVIPMVVAGVGIAAFAVFRAGGSAKTASVDEPAVEEVQAPAPTEAQAPVFDAAPPPPARYRWDGDWPVFADVDGAGSDDLIGALVNLGGLHVAALDGDTGDILWMTDRVVPQGETHRLLLTVVGDTVVATDEGGRAHGFTLATGVLAWTAELGERAHYLCAASGDTVGIATADGRLKEVDAASGEVTDRGRAPRRDGRGCAPVPSRGTQTASRRERFTVGGPRVRGMKATLSVQRGDGPRVVFGVKSPGTPVPRAARLSGRKAAWHVPVSDLDTLELGWPSFGAFADVAGDVAVAVYLDERYSNPGYRAAALSLDDGSRRWDAMLPHGSTSADVLIRGDRIYVTDAYGVMALSLADGSLLFDHGSW